MAVDTDIVIGCVATALALGLVTTLVLWSRRRIDRIADQGFGTVREIRQKLDDDR